MKWRKLDREGRARPKFYNVDPPLEALALGRESCGPEMEQFQEGGNVCQGGRSAWRGCVCPGGCLTKERGCVCSSLPKGGVSAQGGCLPARGYTSPLWTDGHLWKQPFRNYCCRQYQECIAVGCVPPTSVPVSGGGEWRGRWCLPKRVPTWRDVCPAGVSVWGRGAAWGDFPRGVCPGRWPPPKGQTPTGVKTLPSCNFVCGW